MSQYQLPYQNYGAPSGQSNFGGVKSGTNIFGGVSDQSNPFGANAATAQSVNPVTAAVGNATAALTGTTAGNTGADTTGGPITNPLTGLLKTDYGDITLTPEQQTYAGTLTDPQQKLFENVAGFAQGQSGSPGSNPSITNAILPSFAGQSLDYSTILNPYTAAHSQFLTTPEGQTWTTKQNADQEAARVAASQAQASAEARAGEAQHIASQQAAHQTQEQGAYNQLGQYGLGSSFWDYNPSYDYSALIPKLTGDNALSASDSSALNNFLSSYGQGSAFKTNPQLHEQIAQAVSDPESRGKFFEALNFYNDNPSFRPQGTTRYGAGFSQDQINNEQGSDSLATMLGASDYGLEAAKKNKDLWDQAGQSLGQYRKLVDAYGADWVQRAKYSKLGGTGPLASGQGANDVWGYMQSHM